MPQRRDQSPVRRSGPAGLPRGSECRRLGRRCPGPRRQRAPGLQGGGPWLPRSCRWGSLRSGIEPTPLPCGYECRLASAKPAPLGLARGAAFAQRALAPRGGVLCQLPHRPPARARRLTCPPAPLHRRLPGGRGAAATPRAVHPARPLPRRRALRPSQRGRWARPRGWRVGARSSRLGAWLTASAP